MVSRQRFGEGGLGLIPTSVCGLHFSTNSFTSWPDAEI